MALGTITRNPSNHSATADAIVGDLKVTSTSIVGDSSYPTGGSTVTPSQLGLSNVVFAITSVQTVGANGPAEAYYNPSTQKLQAFTGTGEVASTTSLSGATINVVAFGY